MRIANPIYDVVFKYLMEDRESAVLLLSEIIGEEIVELDFHPQESTAEISRQQNRCITVYRLDFAAKIRLKESGYRKVIIEIQKAKFSTDIMRFRRYLSEQYRNRENVWHDEDGNRKALPIISIYFLGHRLRGTDRAVIKVQREYYDGVTGEQLSCREEFIESLTHDSFVVQIPSLQQPYQSRLEHLLSIFDQHRKVSDHILEINEDDYPEEYRQLVRRLIRAAAEKQVMDTMDAEDDILEELENMERTIEKKDKTIKEHREKLEENKKELEGNKKELEEKDRIIRELMEKMKNQ